MNLHILCVNLLILLIHSEVSASFCDRVVHTTKNGRSGNFSIMENTKIGTEIRIILSKEVRKLSSSCLITKKIEKDKKSYIMVLKKRCVRKKIIDYAMEYSDLDTPEVISFVNNGREQCYQSPTLKSKYDYARVLHKSLLFYEAQRSGKLPESNRISWRKNTFLDDGQTVGLDLSGGYFDAGDFMKFNFPAAATLTMLAWGMVEFGNGYKKAGEYENGMAAIKWMTDYFIKCHPEKNVFWAQVGNGVEDHAQVGRPEDYSLPRPCFKIDEENPGSDLAAEVAAGLAASSILFKSKDINYSKKLLAHAKALYDFADQYRGKYSDSISDAEIFYNSWNGYLDELALGAVWLYKATGSKIYLDKAVAILLSGITKKSGYTQNAKGFCSYMKDKAPRTIQGMIHLFEWGSNRYAANSVFACLVVSKYLKGEFNDFSRKQIDLLLGDAGRSYVVGFGKNPPLQPHHKSSTCPKEPQQCTWEYFARNQPNSYTLVGALVGGPRETDGNYEDSRMDYFSNEVTLDYNAGFQSALAGLIHLKVY